MASFVDGADVINAKLKGFDETFAQYMDARLEEEVLALQQRTADGVPVHTGESRAAVMSPDAIQRKPRRGGALAQWIFGLANTRAMAKITYKLFWVEFGTKGYQKGDKRTSGVTRGGRQRTSKIKRNIPARPAQPFFRPAVVEFMVRLRQTRAIAKVYAAAITAAGLNGRTDE